MYVCGAENASRGSLCLESKVEYVRGIWPICGDAYIAAEWQIQPKETKTLSILTVWWGHSRGIGHGLHERSRNVRARRWWCHTRYHRLPSTLLGSFRAEAA